jgi:hypothetical protein
MERKQVTIAVLEHHEHIGCNSPSGKKEYGAVLSYCDHCKTVIDDKLGVTTKKVVDLCDKFKEEPYIVLNADSSLYDPLEHVYKKHPYDSDNVLGIFSTALIIFFAMWGIVDIIRRIF